jgi:aldose sugar dehydrogenase
LTSRIGSYRYLCLATIVLLLTILQPIASIHGVYSQPVRTRAVPFLTGLNSPVALKFAPDGRIFFTEKDSGNIRIILQNGTLLSTPFATVNPVFSDGEAGLLGIALDPSFSSNGYVYVYYTYRDSSSYTHGHIVRYTAVGNNGTAPVSIFDVISSAPGTIYHNGGYIKFGPDGKLYAQVGEFHQDAQSQNQSTTNGKILRMNPDGSVPSDNPFPSSLVWASGIRNAFGFDFDPSNGRLIATMAGPSSDDKIMIIVKGGNYGWPTCLGICNDPRFIDPIVDFNPVVTPTGIATVAANQYYFGEYNTGNLVNLTLTPSGQVVSMKTVLTAPSGIIAVEKGPDNRVYYSTQDAIYAIVPFTVSLPVPMLNLLPYLLTAFGVGFAVLVVYLLRRGRIQRESRKNEEVSLKQTP